MPEYRVEMPEQTTRLVTIEADSEEDALRIATEYRDGGCKWDPFRVPYVDDGGVEGFTPNGPIRVVEEWTE